MPDSTAWSPYESWQGPGLKSDPWKDWLPNLGEEPRRRRDTPTTPGQAALSTNPRLVHPRPAETWLWTSVGMLKPSHLTDLPWLPVFKIPLIYAQSHLYTHTHRRRDTEGIPDGTAPQSFFSKSFRGWQLSSRLPNEVQSAPWPSALLPGSLGKRSARSAHPPQPIPCPGYLATPFCAHVSFQWAFITYSKNKPIKKR